jgi:hypothetical protein
MDRTHVAKSPDPIILRRDFKDRPSGYGKPIGFWYEVDGDWRRWCLDENYRDMDSAHLHRVDLADCNILTIRSASELDHFHRHFRTGVDAYHEEIDWPQVAAAYDGIEIAPYLWERRLTVRWYYGWDCASGVIWRPRNAKVTYLGPVAELLDPSGAPRERPDEAPDEDGRVSRVLVNRTRVAY